MQRAFVSVAFLSCLAVMSCAPSNLASRDSAAAPAKISPKRLVAAIQSEPKVLTNTLVISSGQPGVPELEEMLTQGLIDVDPQGTKFPILAEAIPTLENGLWKVAPDGSMDTTWTIRPGVQWHDGAPFTTDDLIFTLQLVRDPVLLEFQRPALAVDRGCESD